MTDMNRQYLRNDKLERELNAALAKFAAVEPRRGLEDRILVNLRAEQQHNSARTWWHWPAVAALAVVMVLAVSLAWRPGKAVRNITAQPITGKPISILENRVQTMRSGLLGSMTQPPKGGSSHTRSASRQRSPLRPSSGSFPRRSL
jgi:hypothetical protein